MRVGNNKVYIEDVLAIRETEKALLCQIEGEEHWIPKSVIDDDSEVWKDGQEGELVVAEWWAEKDGII